MGLGGKADGEEMKVRRDVEADSWFESTVGEGPAGG